MTLCFERYLKRVSACGPDARFLLEVIVAVPERTDKPWQDLSVRSLAEHLRLDAAVVSSALSELVAAGVLERLAAPREGRVGRRKVTYGLCPGNEPELADRAYPRHVELLQTLFSGEDMVFAVLGSEQGQAGKPGEPGEFRGADKEAAVAKPKKGKHQLSGGRGRLSIRNRLLFAVLLSRSDQFGEVQIGVPELAELAGMKPEQVKTRLDRLMMLGLIRRHIPGLSSKVFASGRVKGTYFLNIDALAPQGAIVVHIAYGKESKQFTHADVLRGDCLKVKSGEQAGRELPDCLIHLLKGQQRRVFVLFQHRLYRYASHLLSCHWQKLALGKPTEDAELMAWIKMDFIKTPKAALAGEVPPELEARTYGEAARGLRDGAGGEARQTCKCIYALAVEIAREYQARLAQADWVGFETADIRILPAMSDIGYRGITILLQPALTGLGHFSILVEDARGVVDIRPEASEADLYLQNRMDFGLASLPYKVKRELGLK